MNSVFISYRREVSSFIARAVFQDLRTNEIDVFMDLESIDSGQFDTAILNQIAARPYFLLILTPGTLDRCNEPGDWLLRELTEAMNLQRVIIPLVTPSFDFKDTKYLPEPLATELSRFNAVKLDHEWFEEGMVRLRTRFLKPIDLAVTPVPYAEEAKVRKKAEEIAAQPQVTEQQLMAQSHFEQGLARPMKNLADKLADYTEAIRLNPLNFNAFYRRGVVYQYKGDYDKALADYDEAIRLDPQFQAAYLARATARNDLGDTEGMFADFSTAIRVNPLHSKPYLDRFAVYYDSGNFGSAITDINKAIQIAPTSGTYSNRAECYFALGQYEKAFADFQRAEQLEGNNPYAAAGMAITLHALGKVEEAKQRWRTLSDLGLHNYDADEIGKELNWAKPLINEARKLVDEL